MKQLAMPSKALYLQAQFDAETQNALAGYYGALRENGFEGSQTKNIPYHFTLGTHTPGDEERLAQELAETCARTACVDIALAHVGLFGQTVLFVAPNMNFELLELRAGFFPGSGKGCHAWSAHATLLIDEPEAVLKALPIVAGRFKPAKARIESVALYEFFPARLVRECRLN